MNFLVKKIILKETCLLSFAQIDLLPDIGQSPRILSEVDAALKAKQMKADVDEYLKVFNSPSSVALAIQYPKIIKEKQS